MSAISGADTCRVTVVGPRRRVDLTLPAGVSFAELFPAVASYAGLDESSAREAPDGWVLQRLGQVPFPAESTPLQAGLRDGELIYLRPRQAMLPEPAFDDVADVIASGIGDRPDRWGPAQTRWVALGAGAAALAAGAVAVLTSGSPWAAPAAAAGVLAVLLLAAAAGLSRAAGDAGAAAVLGYLALPYAFLGGMLGPAGKSSLTHLGALDLLPGFAAALLAAALAAVAVGDGGAVFLGAAAAALLGIGGAWLDYAFGSVGLAGAAALMAALALALTPLIPMVAFRLGRLELPPVPTDVDELRRDTLTVQGGQVLARTAAADRVVTGAVSGIGLVGGFAEVALALGHGWLPRVTCGVLGLALLLRSRVFLGRAQRLWLQVPGYSGLMVLAVAASHAMTVVVRLAPLVVGAAVLTGVGVWLPRHRPSPFWGRAAEVTDMVLVIALVPLALGVAGVFSDIRGLSG
ncbi:MAG TPA: type VII secretion integral membrane protein EccD [Streptosporangiaceae bacterium]|nr:type VII secretion integral membrane protein EccD [Streptosporangiaceae bacterium]